MKMKLILNNKEKIKCLFDCLKTCERDSKSSCKGCKWLVLLKSFEPKKIKIEVED